MPKYNVTIEFSLTTELEPEFSPYTWDSSTVEDFEDGSYFQSVTVESSGGNLSFVVEAENEADAERQAEEIIAEGSEAEDGNGFTWLAEGVNIEVERVSREWSLSEASAVISGYLSENGADEEVVEAFQWLADRTFDLETRLAELRRTLETLDAEVRELRSATVTPITPAE